MDYTPHIRLIGEQNQKRLTKARVLVVGAGGIGCATLMSLALTGVGTIGVADGDRVELANLYRQFLYRRDDIGKQKATVAAERLQELNDDCVLEPRSVMLDEQNAKAIIAPYDMVIDATDNYHARYAVNHVCRALNKPLIYGSAQQWSGRVALFDCDVCYACLFPHDTPQTSCSTVGVLNSLTMLVGSMQATEAIKYLIGEPTLLNKLLVINAQREVYHTYTVQKNPAEGKTEIDINDNKGLRPL